VSFAVLIAVVASGWSVLAHGSSRRILRPQGEQLKRGALQSGPTS